MASTTSEKLRKFGVAAANAAMSLSRPNYFDSNDRGEIYELRNDLNSDIELIKKEAVKKVIASMTVGKDVSNLFADVLKCMQTDDLELKKLVYLYLMNYAKSQPELVILAVNTFCKDTEDPSPYLRALALRTMACIRIERIVDYLCEPLHRTLKDENPYVRKTAVICVAKLFDLSPDLIDENGFLDTLKGMLTDNNPMVISNVVAALADIQEAAPHLEALKIDSRISSKLVGALNECTEWGQVTILDALSEYSPAELEEVEFAIESIIPRLQHANPSVVLSAIKVLVLYMAKLEPGNELRDVVKKKLTPTLVSLMSSPSELQYVALRNVNLILRKYPEILSHGIRVFFCKYNDPLYIKLEKLKIIILLADQENVSQIYPELADYAKEVDVEFVRRAIRAVGEVALKVPNSVNVAMEVLLDMAKVEISYIWQEILITLRDILRHFPGSFESMIPCFCHSFEAYDDSESKAAYVWVIGEYPEALPSYMDVFTDLLMNFKLETFAVQAEVFTAVLKLYLRSPETMEALMSSVIECGKNNTDCAELRERAILYQRLTEIDSNLRRNISLNGSFPADFQVEGLEPRALEVLLSNIARLASVYHKPPSQFVTAIIPSEDMDLDREISYYADKDDVAGPNGESKAPGDAFGDLLNLDIHNTSAAKPKASSPPPSNLLDLLGD